MGGGEPMRTPLYDSHVELGGNIVDFHGFELPIWYTSMMEEHLNCRANAGLFDVSHMGFFRISGEGVREWLEGVATQRVTNISAGRCAYTHFLDEEGRIIDDMIFAVCTSDEIRATGCEDWSNTAGDDSLCILGVPNASMIDTIGDWLSRNLPSDGSIRFENLSEDTSILALQGPASPAILADTLGDENVVRHFRGQAIRSNAFGITGWVQGTGYTGERGFEIFVSNQQVSTLWDALLDKGAAHGISPVGLGARDTLRLEKGFLLSGQDFLWPPLADGEDGDVPSSFLARNTAETYVPFGLSMDHDFIGRSAVEATMDAHDEGEGARWLGVRYLEKGPFPRPGHPVFREVEGGEPVQVGIITSGGPSPSLGKVGIGIGYLEGVNIADEVLIAPNPRKMVRAEIVRTPFL